MGYAENLWLFFILLFGIIVVPGMDMLFVLANALTGGRDRGLAATGGIMVGGMVHTLNGAIGVGLLMHFVPILFKPLLLAGAAYMAFIGITLMRSSITVGEGGPAGSRSAWKAFRQGLVTCLINPKAYLFVLAVYPQFLKPDYGPIWMQATVMGLMTVADPGRDLWRARDHSRPQPQAFDRQSAGDHSCRPRGRTAALRGLRCSPPGKGLRAA